MNMLSRLSAVLLLLMPLWPLQAQQLPYYSQFRNFQSIINPASVNSDYFLYEYNASLMANYRAQWINQEETPRTVHLCGEYISRTGGAFELLAGGVLLEDRTGPFGITGVYGRLGTIFSRDPYMGGLSVGISFGMLQQRVSADRITWFDPADPRIPELNISETSPDLGIGLFYYRRIKQGWLAEDNIYAGLSVPQLIGRNNESVSGANTVALSRVPHLFVTGGWYHFINEDAFLEVSTWAKWAQGVNPNIDIMGRFQPMRTVWFGAGFNLNGIVHLETGLNLPEFLSNNGSLKMGYAFDYNISAFDVPFGTSHELTLAYLLDVGDRH